MKATVLILAFLAATYSVIRDANKADAENPGVITVRNLLAGLVGGLAAWAATPVLKSILLVNNQSASIQEQVMISNQAVQAVETAIQEMDTSTTRLQKFAIAIGIGTALVGAVLGGFIGAWAATVIGH